jgi:RNA polymerase sigma factor (TIGR02999 family)
MKCRWRAATNVEWVVEGASVPGTRTFREGQSGELLEAVYDQLRAIAQQRMSAENPGHSLQATALVHEAFLRIGHGRRVPFQDRAHFFAAAAEAMRRILIDHARAKGAVKRRGSGARLTLSVVDLAEGADPGEILALDEALERLEGAEPEVAAVVRLRFFAGLSVDDTSEALAISPRQVDRLWAYARAWLAREVRPPG